jgi:hypothetical protein
MEKFQAVCYYPVRQLPFPAYVRLCLLRSDAPLPGTVNSADGLRGFGELNYSAPGNICKGNDAAASVFIFMGSSMRKMFLTVLFLVCGWQVSAYCAESAQSFPLCEVADKLVVEKSKRRLMLFANGKVLKVYRIALGKQPIGAKQREGDKKTPEGNYFIDYHKRDSNYHLALHISYPNEDDLERARREGVEPGSAIMIHGIMNGWGWLGELHLAWDWTGGCIAVTNEEMEELWWAVPDGTPIEIRP